MLARRRRDPPRGRDRRLYSVAHNLATRTWSGNSPEDAMSDEATHSGQVRSTPEGGPLDAGAPAQEPGAGQVRTTPEAAPLSEGQVVQPPAWREQMRGPIPGLDAAVASGTAAQGSASTSAATGSERVTPISAGREVQTGAE